jgi:predicted NAD-dependent protein-ADP-ribosyltransferase YbiA (DUF1768 family)
MSITRLVFRKAEPGVEEPSSMPSPDSDGISSLDPAHPAPPPAPPPTPTPPASTGEISASAVVPDFGDIRRFTSFTGSRGKGLSPYEIYHGDSDAALELEVPRVYTASFNDPIVKEMMSRPESEREYLFMPISSSLPADFSKQFSSSHSEGARADIVEAARPMLPPTRSFIETSKGSPSISPDSGEHEPFHVYQAALRKQKDPGAIVDTLVELGKKHQEQLNPTGGKHKGTVLLCYEDLEHDFSDTSKPHFCHRRAAAHVIQSELQSRMQALEASNPQGFARLFPEEGRGDKGYQDIMRVLQHYVGQKDAALPPLTNRQLAQMLVDGEEIPVPDIGKGKNFDIPLKDRLASQELPADGWRQDADPSLGVSTAPLVSLAPGYHATELPVFNQKADVLVNVASAIKPRSYSGMSQEFMERFPDYKQAYERWTTLGVKGCSAGGVFWFQPKVAPDQPPVPAILTLIVNDSGRIADPKAIASSMQHARSWLDEKFPDGAQIAFPIVHELFQGNQPNVATLLDEHFGQKSKHVTQVSTAEADPTVVQTVSSAPEMSWPVKDFPEESQEYSMDPLQTIIFGGSHVPASAENRSLQFGNFARTPFRIMVGKMELEFPTVEHLYQALKFSQGSSAEALEVQRNIMLNTDPVIAKEIAKENSHLIRADWEDVNLDAMKFCVIAKAFSNPQFLQNLIDTGNMPIVEASPLLAPRTPFGNPSFTPEGIRQHSSVASAYFQRILSQREWAKEFAESVKTGRYSQYIRDLRNPPDDEIPSGEKSPPIQFTQSSDMGYPGRTRENAKGSDITIDFATTPTGSGGPRGLTKRATTDAKKKYAHVAIAKDGTIDVEKSVNNIVKKIKSCNKKSITINVAGYALKEFVDKLSESSNISQETCNKLAFDVLKRVQEELERQDIAIKQVRSGGQTGFDEAGIIAAAQMNIPALVHAPRGWLFRSSAGIDVRNEAQFKKRFLQKTGGIPTQRSSTSAGGFNDEQIAAVSLKIRESHLEALRTKPGFEDARLADDGDGSTVILPDEQMQILRGYEPTMKRVMVGNHGVYLECERPQVSSQYPIGKKHRQYDEYRNGSVMYYRQKLPVNYAEYVPGLWYSSIGSYFSPPVRQEHTTDQYAPVDKKELMPDVFWGTAVDENNKLRGRNELGKILEAVRAEFIAGTLTTSQTYDPPDLLVRTGTTLLGQIMGQIPASTQSGVAPVSARLAQSGVSWGDLRPSADSHVLYEPRTKIPNVGSDIGGGGTNAKDNAALEIVQGLDTGDLEAEQGFNEGKAAEILRIDMENRQIFQEYVQRGVQLALGSSAQGKLESGIELGKREDEQINKLKIELQKTREEGQIQTPEDNEEEDEEEDNEGDELEPQPEVTIEERIQTLEHEISALEKEKDDRIAKFAVSMVEHTKICHAWNNENREVVPKLRLDAINFGESVFGDLPDRSISKLTKKEFILECMKLGKLVTRGSIAPKEKAEFVEWATSSGSPVGADMSEDDIMLRMAQHGKKISQKCWDTIMVNMPEILRLISLQLQNSAFRGKEVEDITQDILLRIQENMAVLYTNRDTQNDKQPIGQFFVSQLLGPQGIDLVNRVISAQDPTRAREYKEREKERKQQGEDRAKRIEQVSLGQNLYDDSTATVGDTVSSDSYYNDSMEEQHEEQDEKEQLVAALQPENKKKIEEFNASIADAQKLIQSLVKDTSDPAHIFDSIVEIYRDNIVYALQTNEELLGLVEKLNLQTEPYHIDPKKGAISGKSSKFPTKTRLVEAEAEKFMRAFFRYSPKKELEKYEAEMIIGTPAPENQRRRFSPLTSNEEEKWLKDHRKKWFETRALAAWEKFILPHITISDADKTFLDKVVRLPQIEDIFKRKNALTKMQNEHQTTITQNKEEFVDTEVAKKRTEFPVPEENLGAFIEELFQDEDLRDFRPLWDQILRHQDSSSTEAVAAIAANLSITPKKAKDRLRGLVTRMKECSEKLSFDRKSPYYKKSPFANITKFEDFFVKK